MGQYSARCKTLLQLASKKGAKINKHHSDGWDGIIRETKNFIEEETCKILADIDEISEAVRQSKKRSREQGKQGNQMMFVYYLILI